MIPTVYNIVHIKTAGICFVDNFGDDHVVDGFAGADITGSGGA